jgi:tRNA-splicing ligase RtcB
MLNKSDFKKINDYLWEYPKTGRMNVQARIYASEKMLDEVFKDKSVEQLINTASLPGILNYSMAMPDIHEGYGFPIGGVAAMDKETGVISPGGVGYDINCGMKLLKSELTEQEIKPYLDKLATGIQKEVPSGLGKGRQIKLSIDNLDKILKYGAKQLVEQGYGEGDDIKNCESNGFIEQVDPETVSSHAKNRGRDQVGTLGSGNHFLEIQKVEEIFDEEIAKKFGLFKNQILVMIHTGSRGLGHQIATDYIQVMMRAMPKYNIDLPDRELACTPFKSNEGQRYFSAMSAGANYAWANRQMIAYYIRMVWKKILGEKTKLTAIYDVAHNIAKLEKYKVNEEEKELIVHRKGATRAFPGQPVLIPGSMGTASYVLVGTEQGKNSWYSTCHGAGRTMSRHAAIRALSGQEIINQLKAKGILVKCYSMRGIAEEAPQAYKDIDEVVAVVHQAGLSQKVARLVPLAVIKGE